MVDARFSVQSTDLKKALNKAKRLAIDLTPVWDSIAKSFYKAEKFIFKLKSAGQYVDFQGLKIKQTWSTENPRPKSRKRDGEMTAYQWFKKKRGITPKGYPLLKLSGALEKSIISPDDANSILEIKKFSLTIGTKVPYGIFHQEGTRVLPQRQFLFLDPSTTGFKSTPEFSRRNKAWTKTIKNYVERIAKTIEGGGKNVPTA